MSQKEKDMNLTAGELTELLKDVPPGLLVGVNVGVADGVPVVTELFYTKLDGEEVTLFAWGNARRYEPMEVEVCTNPLHDHSKDEDGPRHLSELPQTLRKLLTNEH